MAHYDRVLPRDLFNEADLLKCYGRLWILLDEDRIHHARFEEEQVNHFDIAQDQTSGALTIQDMHFSVLGTRYRLERPLNARSPWPLWVAGSDEDPDFEEIRVFDEDGNLSQDMLNLIQGKGPHHQ